MNAWLIAFLFCIPPLAGAAYRALSGRSAQRLVATELAVCIGTFMLLGPAEGQFRRAVALAPELPPGTLVFTHFLERWL